MINLNLQNIDLFFVAVTVCSIAILGFVTFFNNKKSVTNRTFLAFSLIAIFYSLVNYLSYHTNSVWLALWFLRFVLFSVVIYSFLLFQLFYVFPNEKSVFPKWFLRVLVPVSFFTAILVLTPYVFVKIENFAPIGTVSEAAKGPGMIVFGTLIIGLVLGGLYVLLKKTIKATGVEREQFSFVLIGAFISYISLIIFNFILPVVFRNLSLIPLAPIFTLPFIIFTSYAIIRHKLFNVRVAGTAVLVFALSIVSFIEVTQTDNLISLIYRSSVLFFILVFGILLIRGVLREVKQREKIEVLNKELEVANEKLQDLDKFKNQFFVQARHDLRTPMTSIVGYADLIISGTLGKTPKKIVEVTKKIETSAQNMRTMAESFLDTAQFQLGRSPLQLKPDVSLQALLNEILDQSKTRAEQEGIYLKLEKTEKDIVITADKEKLKSALSNIVGNAIKYTKQGGVNIELESDDQNATIVISDTGIGIPADKIKTIFEQKFERSKEAQQTAEGRGVGLYLSGQIIKYHQGKAWAESAGEGKGSTFYIELPLKIDENISTEQSILTGKI